MKFPTKRIFYHLEVLEELSTPKCPSVHACARYQHVAVTARTCPPASLPSVRAGAHKKPGSGTLPGF